MENNHFFFNFFCGVVFFLTEFDFHKMFAFSIFKVFNMWEIITMKRI